MHAIAVAGQALTTEVQFCLTGMQEHLVGETAIQVGADPHAVGQLLMQAAVTARVDCRARQELKRPLRTGWLGR